MKKKNYLAYVYKKLILWLIISALLTVGIGELSYKEYDCYVNGLKKGEDAGNLTCYLTARYLSCALRNDPRLNQYKSRMKVIPDYEYFAKVKDDGSLETIYKTNYDDIYYEVDKDGANYDRSFEAQISSTYVDYYDHSYSIIDDRGNRFGTNSLRGVKEEIAYLEQTEKDRKYYVLYIDNESYITSDYANKRVPDDSEYYEVGGVKKNYDVQLTGNEPLKTEFVKYYHYCLNRKDLDYFMDRAHELKRLQNTHALIADKDRSVFSWLNTDGSYYEESSLLGSLVTKYEDLYNDDLKMDYEVNPKWFVLNNKKYEVGNWNERTGETYTIPSVYKKPEKLLTRYKNILEPKTVDVQNTSFYSLFMSNDKETGLLMNYGFDARYSSNYYFNYGYIMQYGLIQTKEGDYYYAFATPLAGFWETEGSVILVFFVIVLAVGLVLINLFSVLSYIVYTNRYNNTAFKNGLIDALAHNLKNPMQIISVNAENIKDTDSPEEKDGHADIILSQTESVNDMVEKILKAADRKPVRSVCEIREVIEQMAEKIGVEVVINGTGKIKADREFFEQAIYNLIDNANKYRSEGDILVNIKKREIEIVNNCDSEEFTPGAGIAIADRFLIQNGMRLKLKVNDGSFTADIYL